jgi:hypothetical protein
MIRISPDVDTATVLSSIKVTSNEKYGEHVISLSNVPSLFRITNFVELLSVNNILLLGQITHPLEKLMESLSEDGSLKQLNIKCSIDNNILDLVSTITTFGSVAMETGSQTVVNMLFSCLMYHHYSG